MLTTTAKSEIPSTVIQAQKVVGVMVTTLPMVQTRKAA